MTSSILPPRRDFAPCSPITQVSASTTFDLPEPLGPTTQVMPGSSRSVVAEAKDLNPLRVRLFKYTRLTYRRTPHWYKSDSVQVQLEGLLIFLVLTRRARSAKVFQMQIGLPIVLLLSCSFQDLLQSLLLKPLR